MGSSVIVVSHVAHRWLRPCLQSAAVQADELVVVDNGSSDATIGETAREVGAVVCRVPKNLGFAGGVNAGLEIARGDVIGLLNDDAMAAPDWLAISTRILEDPTIAAVAPKLLFVGRFEEISFPEESHFAPGDGRPLGRQLFEATADGVDVLAGLVGGVHALEEGNVQGRDMRWRWTKGREPVYVPVGEGEGAHDIRINGELIRGTWRGDVVNNAGSYLSVHGYGGDFGYETPDCGQFDDSGERFAATGAAMVARTATFRSVGGLGRRFFAYYEDTDWCWRARLAGLRIFYEPSAIVRHVRSVTSGGEGKRLVRLLGARNRILCLARNAPIGFFTEQCLADWRAEPVDGLRRSLIQHVPVALLERGRLRRRWALDPQEVLDRWAGVHETWEKRSACH